MSWQNTGFPYPSQQGPPPPGFYPNNNPFPGAYPPGIPPFSGTSVYPEGIPPTIYPPGGNMNNQYGYEEPPASTGLAFSDKKIRQGFIRKVYSILMLQLLITGCMIALFYFHEGIKRQFATMTWLIVAVVVTLVCMIAMTCFESVRRTPPTNYIFLFIFTVAEGFLLGILCIFYELNEILLAVGICAVLCFALTVFAFQTKVDFTMMGGILMVGVIILMIFGIILMFFPNAIAPIRLIYAGLGAFLFSIYLIYDTQLMIGGNHKYSISPEEYVFAALSIYLDIINIFIFILQIIGESRD